jgi:hypothetical protein
VLEVVAGINACIQNTRKKATNSGAILANYLCRMRHERINVQAALNGRDPVVQQSVLSGRDPR